MENMYTVLICTYNQCASLAKVIASMASQCVDVPEKVEVIVVDNNSTDATRDICNANLSALPFAYKYIFEPRQGLSIARNRGVFEAKGSVIVFTDDDARIPANWLQAHIDEYEKMEADCVYGKILIDWDKGRPYWYSEHYRSMFVGLDYGDEKFVVSDLQHEFYGKNFSVKKEIIKNLGGFDENLGRKGDRLFIGEETKIYRNLITGGYRVIYTPQAYLFHMLKDYEYTLEHFKKYYRDATLSEYYMLKTTAEKRFFGRPLYVLRKSANFLVVFPFRCVMAWASKENGVQRRLYLWLECRKHLQLLGLWFRNA